MGNLAEMAVAEVVNNYNGEAEKMTKNQHAVQLSEYEYDVLSKNKMISAICGKALESAKTVRVDKEEMIELSVTVVDLEELVGYVAAEANHATSSRKQEDLNEICDYLEGRLYELKWG